MSEFDVSVNEEQYAALCKWAEALPTFKKTVGCLKKDEGQCCIGVACTLSEIAPWHSWPFTSRYLGEGMSAPVQVQAHYGFQNGLGFAIPLTLIREFIPGFNASQETITLAAFNDSVPSGPNHELTTKILKRFIEKHVKVQGKNLGEL